MCMYHDTYSNIYVPNHLKGVDIYTYIDMLVCMANPSNLVTQFYLIMGIYICMSIYAANPSHNPAHLINPRHIHMHVRMCH
jgi:hypothetical protein